MATKQYLILAVFIFTSFFCNAQDLVSGGTNTWIMHTPDDGRTMMAIAPGTNGTNFNFAAATQFMNTGDVQFSGNSILGGANSWMFHTPDDGRKTLYITPGAWGTGWNWSNAVSISELGSISANTIVCPNWLRTTGATGWFNNTYGVGINAIDSYWVRACDGGGNNNKGFAAAQLFSYGETYVGGKLTVAGEISAPGRFHITGGEYLYILNHDGVIIGKEFGGNGNLQVQGTILTSRVKVAVNGGANWNWADYVFAKEYKLKPLHEVEAYINENKHLEGIPTTDEVQKDGIDVAPVTAKLLEKIEELTLYMIELNKKVDVLEKENLSLKK